MLDNSGSTENQPGSLEERPWDVVRSLAASIIQARGRSRQLHGTLTTQIWAILEGSLNLKTQMLTFNSCVQSVGGQSQFQVHSFASAAELKVEIPATSRAKLTSATIQKLMSIPHIVDAQGTDIAAAINRCKAGWRAFLAATGGTTVGKCICDDGLAN